MTQHAMLVVWGLFARRIGLVQAIKAVALKQKTREHRPQTKALGFLVAILVGLPHLQDAPLCQYRVRHSKPTI